jgi:hypothetical protein
MWCILFYLFARRDRPRPDKIRHAIKAAAEMFGGLPAQKQAAGRPEVDPWGQRDSPIRSRAIALWRYLQTGMVPTGAKLKASNR